jgi:hypothetical protein
VSLALEKGGEDRTSRPTSDDHDINRRRGLRSGRHGVVSVDSVLAWESGVPHALVLPEVE